MLPLASLPRTWKQRLGWIPPVLQAVAITLVCVALARPVRGNSVRQTISEGIDIALVVDRSGSMKYDDLEPRKTRLDVAKEVVGAFAQRTSRPVVVRLVSSFHTGLTCLSGECIVGSDHLFGTGIS